MDIERRSQLRFDATALYSVTDQRTADQITDILLALPGVDCDTTPMIDGTACVGGNVISFAGYGNFAKCVPMHVSSQYTAVALHIIESRV
eukprot:5734-Heterococcus_DN1.PRE.4